MFRFLAVLGLATIVAFSSSTSEAAQKKKKKKGNLTGVVTEVQKNKDQATLKILAKGKKGAPAEDKSVTITKDTKIEKVTGKKGQQQTAEANLEAIQKGVNLVVEINPNQANQAAKVSIIQKKK